jgi:hypothetical protein
MLDSVLKETALLEEEASRAEIVNSRLREPLTVAEECLAIRKRRPSRELTRDAVERALNEQVKMRKKSPNPKHETLDCGHVPRPDRAGDEEKVQTRNMKPSNRLKALGDDHDMMLAHEDVEP